MTLSITVNRFLLKFDTECDYDESPFAPLLLC
jgi:hypothetical protein